MEVDWLRNLPESLLFEVLLKVPTKDLVKTSVLSSSWRNQWKSVPGFDLTYRRDFRRGYNAFVSFMDGFLGFDSVSCIQNFKLEFEYDHTPNKLHLTRWITKVIERKVQHLDVCNRTLGIGKEVGIPTTVYTCESLVSLKLYATIFHNPVFASLPSLKVIFLYGIVFDNDLAFEMIISGCPVLESLTVSNVFFAKFLRVCSLSLLRFTYKRHVIVKDLVIAIDAPRLEYLKLDDYDTCIIENPVSLVKVDIDRGLCRKEFNQNDLPKRNMIRNFLIRISSVKVFHLSSFTLEEFNRYSICEPLPLFCNLSFLHVDFRNYKWEVLPIFLESCPNLKSLSLGFSKRQWGSRLGTAFMPEPRQLLTSLEYVKIVKLMLEEAKHMKLVSYFMDNSPILKKFTLFLGGFKKNEEPVILKKLLAMPRLSSSCEILVSEYVDT